MNIFVLRHAIAVEREEWNGDDAERPLTPEGEAQQRQVCIAMKRLALKFDLVLSSPYERAKRTAEIVAKTITVFGSVKGNVTAHDRLDIRSTASVEGEVICTRISIQEGAAFCGKVTMGNRKAKANGADTDSPAMLAAAV